VVKLRVALYYPYIHLRSGVERTILEILRRSRHDWHVFTNLYEKDTTYPELENFRSRITELKKVSAKRSYLNTLKSAWTIFNQKLPVEKFDILWVHNEGLGSLINFKNKDIRKICFCHTPLKIVYDRVLRKNYLARNMYKAPFYFLFSFLFKILDKKAFSLYDYCFCVSGEVKNRILQNGLLPGNKLEVIYRGVDVGRFSGEVEYGDYFFHPARIKWWKNIESSIKAFSFMQKQYKRLKDFRLVIAGELYPTNKGYYKRIRKMAAANKNIELVVNPEEKQIMDFYKDCRAVVSTTLNEDFGLTVLEGFSFSKPVLAINRGGPKEVIRHGITGFLSPEKIKEYAGYMARLTENKDLAVKMGAEARKDVMKYNWDGFINYIDGFLEGLMHKNRNGMDRNLSV
jgi:glycosyltransferase involved in cell wall biosynthesis